MNSNANIIKRGFDLVGSCIGLVILSPILLIVGLIIKAKMNDGPVLFRQKRIGKDGKSFIMVKFRTMNMNHGGSSISVSGESRITPLGAILRKYKIDELPELWNVIKGDMSFVGPRPDVPGCPARSDMTKTTMSCQWQSVSRFFSPLSGKPQKESLLRLPARAAVNRFSMERVGALFIRFRFSMSL